MSKPTSETDKLVEDLKREIEELRKMVQGEIENRKKLAKLIINIGNQLEQHLNGKMTIDDIQSCMQRVQEMVSILESTGMIRQGEGNGGLLATALAQMLRQQQEVQTPTIERMNTSSKKLKKLLESDDEEEDEGKE